MIMKIIAEINKIYICLMILCQTIELSGKDKKLIKFKYFKECSMLITALLKALVLNKIQIKLSKSYQH